MDLRTKLVFRKKYQSNQREINHILARKPF